MVRVKTPAERGLSEAGHAMELARALNATAATLQQSAHSEEEVFRAFCEQISGLRLRGGISVLDETGQYLCVRAVAQPGALRQSLAHLEKVVGLKAEGYVFPLARVDVYRRVVEGGQAEYTSDGSSVVAQVIAAAARPGAERGVETFGSDPVICAPMVNQKRVVGVLNIAGADLLPADVPAIQAFANHIAIALMNARLFATLRESEQRYRDLFENAGDIVYTHDLAGNFTSLNKAAERVTGYARSRALAMNISQIVAPEYVESLRRALAPESPGQGSQIHELEFIAMDGRRVPVELSTRLILQDGKPVGVQGIARDMTVRRHPEEALRESDRRFREVLENVHLIAVALDPHGKITFCNDYLLSVTGWQREQVIGQDWFDLFIPADVPLRPIFFGSIERGTIPLHHENDIVTRQGERRLILWNNTVLRDRRDNVIGTVSIGEDITERQRAERNLERRAREMAALYQTALEINSQPDLSTLLHTIVRRAAELLNTQMGGLYLLRPGGDTLELVVSHNLPRDYAGTVLHLGEGLSGRIAQTGEPTMVPDYQNWEGRAAAFSDSPFRRVLGVPLKSGHRLIGVLNATDVEKTGPFGEDEIRLASLFADQAAIAIENARLLKEEKQRADEFSALYEMAGILATQRDQAALLQSIIDRATALLDAPGAFIYLYDAARDDLSLTLVKGVSVPPGTRLKMGEGMAGRVAQNRQPLIVDDYRTWEHRSTQYEGMPFAGVVEVPMQYGGELIGVLAVNEIAPTQRRFTDTDARLLSLFAGQAASAVHQARLYEAEQRRAERLTRIMELGIELAGLRQERAVLETVVTRTAAIANSATCTVMFVENGAQHAVVAAQTGLPESALGMRVPLTLPTLRQSLESLAPVIVSDIDRDAPDLRTLLVRQDIRSFFAYPMAREGRTIGVITLSHLTPHDPSGEEIAAFRLLADRTAAALENARLFEQTQRRADDLATINQISAAINQPFALTDVLNNTLRELTRALDVDRAGVATFGDSRDHLTVIAEHSPRGGPSALGSTIAVAGNPSMEHVLREKRALAVADAQNDAFLGSAAALLRDLGTQSILISPLIVRDEVIGTIGLDSQRGQRVFTPDEIALAETIAHQAASAIEKARLFHAEETRRVELAALYDLSRALADQRDLDTMLNLVVQRAVRILHVTFAALALLEGDAFIRRAASSVRPLARDIEIGRGEPAASLPFCKRTLEQNASIVLPMDSSELTDFERETLFMGSAQTLCLVPLRVSERALGLLILGEARQENREPFTAEKVRLANSIGDQAAGAIQRAALHAETEQRLRRLGALRNVDMAIGGSLDLQVTLDILLAQVTTQLGVDAAAILLLRPVIQTLTYAAGRGFRTTGVTRSQLRVGEGYAGRAVLERNIVSVPNLAESQEHLARSRLLSGEEFVSYYAVPLIAKGMAKGVLEIFHRAPLETNQEWMDFMETLAEQAAIAIDNTELFNSLQQSNLELTLAYDTTLEGWSRALDLRDRETEGHTQRVVEMTLELARAMGIPDQDLVHVRRGALLHDIGKMGIPDSILFKPGPLTDEETQIMRRHPTYAFELLSPIVHLRPAIDIPYCHHERWDGSGYPRRLKGNQIPMAARVFAAVDVWDALRSDRPYRPAWPEESVREYIRQNGDAQFDPKVVEAFLTQIE